MQKPWRTSHDVKPGQQIYKAMANLSKNSVNLSKVYETISETVKPRSAWARGVRETGWIFWRR